MPSVAFASAGNWPALWVAAAAPAMTSRTFAFSIDVTPEAVQALHQAGLHLVMLTGDNRATAEAVAASLGLDDVIAELQPEQKIETADF